MKQQRLKVGNHVWYRLYNTPEQKFYGDLKKGIVVSLESENRDITIITDNGFEMSLWRKEIKGIIHN